MIVIADSGSTKTHLKVIDEKGTEIKDIYIPGINPFYQTTEEIHFTINNKLSSQIDCENVSHFYFYGAGCSFPDKKNMLTNALSATFRNADIFVENDLLGAARALFGENDGVACILGTGSNSCLYKNGKIDKNVSPLGFILGDEGSGAVLGKLFVANCMKNLYPEDLISDFYQTMKTSPADIMNWTYKKTFPNRYLASLVPYIAQNIDRKEIKELVEENFRQFFKRNIVQYSITPEMRIGFIGSIGVEFKQQLESVASEFGYKISKIEKEPIEGMVAYHLGKLKQTT